MPQRTITDALNSCLGRTLNTLSTATGLKRSNRRWPVRPSAIKPFWTSLMPWVLTPSPPPMAFSKIWWARPPQLTFKKNVPLTCQRTQTTTLRKLQGNGVIMFIARKQVAVSSNNGIGFRLCCGSSIFLLKL